MSEEAAPINNGAPSQVPFQFRLVHLLYATAVFAAGMAGFGVVGTVWSIAVLTFWDAVFLATPDRVKSLRWACKFLWVLAIFALFVAWQWLAISTPRSLYHRASCTNNLKQIVIALHAYHEAHGTFPPAYVADAQGKPMHSWRVLILPYLGEQALYNRYNFNEPWDGPNNLKLVAIGPSVFRCPAHAIRGTGTTTATHYVAVVGAQTAWPGANGREFAEFNGNAPNTIHIIEVGDRAVHWLEPRDVTVDEAVQMLTRTDSQKAGVHRSKGFFYEEVRLDGNVAMADGSVPYFGGGISADKARSLLTIGGDIKIEDLDFQWSQRTHRPRLGNWFRLAVFLTLALFPLPWVWRKRADSGSGQSALRPKHQAS